MAERKQQRCLDLHVRLFPFPESNIHSRLQLAKNYSIMWYFATGPLIGCVTYDWQRSRESQIVVYPTPPINRNLSIEPCTSTCENPSCGRLRCFVLSYDGSNYLVEQDVAVGNKIILHSNLITSVSIHIVGKD
ncbi:hypothetical protein OUZ56_011059 [Daphnia magna]|uniref:Uncharacterized protein n=1 Tax=Daphnia magna TaxID=35525 RepID=A0ABQ9YZ59_9CRUS|nr:hypothetical protein OUZ56_011059 [Daphnia magna]